MRRQLRVKRFFLLPEAYDSPRGEPVTSLLVQRSNQERTPGFGGGERPAKAGLKLHYPPLLAKSGGCGTHLPLTLMCTVLWTVPESRITPTFRFDSPHRNPDLCCAARRLSRGPKVKSPSLATNRICVPRHKNRIRRSFRRLRRARLPGLVN